MSRVIDPHGQVRGNRRWPSEEVTRGPSILFSTDRFPKCVGLANLSLNQSKKESQFTANLDNLMKKFSNDRADEKIRKEKRAQVDPLKRGQANSSFNRTPSHGVEKSLNSSANRYVSDQRGYNSDLRSYQDSQKKPNSAINSKTHQFFEGGQQFNSYKESLLKDLAENAKARASRNYASASAKKYNLDSNSSSIRPLIPASSQTAHKPLLFPSSLESSKLLDRYNRFNILDKKHKEVFKTENQSFKNSEGENYESPLKICQQDRAEKQDKERSDKNAEKNPETSESLKIGLKFETFGNQRGEDSSQKKQTFDSLYDPIIFQTQNSQEIEDKKLDGFREGELSSNGMENRLKELNSENEKLRNLYEILISADESFSQQDYLEAKNKLLLGDISGLQVFESSKGSRAKVERENKTIKDLTLERLSDEACYLKRYELQLKGILRDLKNITEPSRQDDTLSNPFYDESGIQRDLQGDSELHQDPSKSQINRQRSIHRERFIQPPKQEDQLEDSLGLHMEIKVQEGTDGLEGTSEFNNEEGTQSQQEKEDHHHLEDVEVSNESGTNLE